MSRPTGNAQTEKEHDGNQNITPFLNFEIQRQRTTYFEKCCRSEELNNLINCKDEILSMTDRNFAKYSKNLGMSEFRYTGKLIEPFPNAGIQIEENADIESILRKSIEEHKYLHQNSFLTPSEIRKSKQLREVLNISEIYHDRNSEENSSTNEFWEELRNTNILQVKDTKKDPIQSFQPEGQKLSLKVLYNAK